MRNPQSGVHGAQNLQVADRRRILNHIEYNLPIDEQIPGQTGRAKQYIRRLNIEHPHPALGIRLPAALRDSQASDCAVLSPRVRRHDLPR